MSVLRLKFRMQDEFFPPLSHSEAFQAGRAKNRWLHAIWTRESSDHSIFAPHLESVLHAVKARFRVSAVTVTVVQLGKVLLKVHAGKPLASLDSRDALVSCALSPSAEHTLYVAEDIQPCSKGSLTEVTEEKGLKSIRFYAGSALLADPGGSTIGILCLLDTIPRSFNEADRDLLQAIAAAISAMLAMRANPDSAAALGLASTESMLLMDAAQGISAVNARFSQLTEFEKPDLKRMGLEQLLCLDRPHGGALSLSHALLAGEPAHGMTRCVIKNGSALPVEVFIFPLADQRGDPVQTLILITPLFSGPIEDFLLSLRATERSELLSLHIAGLWAIDTRGLITELSGEVVSQCGSLRASDLLGKRLNAIALFDKQSTDWTDFYQCVADNKPLPALECRIDCCGKSLWYSIKGFQRRSASGHTIGYHGSFLDITQRKQKEQLLAASERKFRNLSDLSVDWYWEQDAEHRFVHIGSQIKAVGDFGPAFYLGKTRWEIHSISLSAAEWQEHRAVMDAHVPFKNFELKTVDAAGHPFWVSLSGTPRFSDAGVFEGYHGTGRNITERKELIESLQQAQVRLGLVLQGSNDGAWDWNLETGVFFMSERGWQIFGIEPSDAIDDFNAMAEFVHEADRQTVSDTVRNILKNTEQMYSIEFRAKHVSGRVIPVLGRGMALRNEAGRALRMSGMISDMTSQHQTQSRIRLLESCIQSLQDVVLITHASPRGKPGPFISYVNDAFERFTGFTRAEVIGQTPRILQGPETSRTTLDQIAFALSQWQPIRAELANYKKNGELFWVELEIIPVRAGGGDLFTHWVGVQRDITQRKSAEQVLQATLQRLSMALEAGGIGMWAMHVVGGQEFADARWHAMLGHEPDERPRPIGTWLGWVHPDDWLEAKRMQEELLVSLQPSLQHEFRMQHKNGSSVWILSTGKVMERSSTGQPLLIVGTHLDVTARVQARLLAQRQHQQLANCLEHLQVGVLVQKDGAIRFANSAMLRLFGYDALSDVLGSHFMAHIAKGDVEIAQLRQQQLLAGAELPSYWFECRHRNGPMFRALIHSTLVEWENEVHILSTLTLPDDSVMLSAEIESTRRHFERLLITQLEAKQMQIAHELHDSLGSQLAGISLQAAALRQLEPGPLLLDIAVQQLLGAIKKAAEMTRGLAHGLVPVERWPGSFWRALEILCSDFNKTDGLRCDFEMCGDFDAVCAETGNHLYRITQEAISNAVRHGGAARIEVRLEREGDACALSIVDDGTGFDVPTMLTSLERGMGLSSMYARARSISAEIVLQCTKPRGFSVLVRWQHTDTNDFLV